MKIGLLTDAPKHNLALMKLSTYHKSEGDEIVFNLPLFQADYTYASVLFEKNMKLFSADEFGGPAFNGAKLTDDVEKCRPDYSLFGRYYSLGYTYRPCFNTCGFCKVPQMNHPDIDHHSIWEFHDSKFKKICILNNNTFQDPRWKETFKEIWGAELTVIDENGYDLRLLDDEKAMALKKTKFQGLIHFAWDRMQDEPLIMNGIKCLNKYNIRNVRVYLLIGYNTNIDEDIHRFQKITDYGYHPYIMPFIKNSYTRRMRDFCNLRFYTKYKTIKDAWRAYL